MKHLITLVICMVALVQTAFAQLPNGSIAPDFTATDINGNSWNLYQLLNQGKTVYLDVSATWCGPCWNYHNTHALEDLYTQYGPGGTNEVMVFLVEGDASTTLADLMGTGTNTQGNWVTGTPYPIIDNADIANSYQITYFPTIYQICPNRIVTEAGQLPTADLYALKGGCLAPYGANNAGLLGYKGFEGTFCKNKSWTPSIVMQNLGTAPLTSAKLEMIQDGTVKQTINWTGNLSTFNFEEITFDPITVTQNSNIELKVSNPNGVNDDDTSNDVHLIETTESMVINKNLLTLELKTDNYPAETFWTLSNSNGDVLYHWGNAAVAQYSDPSTLYTGKSTVYTHQIPVPADECYDFTIYDAYGDGICCAEGNGYYQLKDEAGNILLEGASFGKQKDELFQTKDVSAIANNAAIVKYNGIAGDFCTELQFTPIVTLQNLGAAALTSAKLEVKNSTGTVLDTYNWNGSIASGKSSDVALHPLSLTATSNLTVHIAAVNNAADTYDYNNSVDFAVSRNVTQKQKIKITIKTDTYGYETFWALLNSLGVIVASGGNTKVGLTGGGARKAASGDPGAYGNNTTVVTNVTLPEADCYTLVLVDDYGDGFSAGYYKVDEVGGVNIMNRVMSTGAISEDNLVDAGLITATQEINGLERISLSPNPANSQLMLQFGLKDGMNLQFDVVNTLGQLVQSIPANWYSAGPQSLRLDVSEWQSGVYFLRMSDGVRVNTRRFTVTH